MTDICVEACLSNASYSESFEAFHSNYKTAVVAQPVVTDLIVIFPPAVPPSDSKWHRIEKDLYLNTSQQSAWLYVALVNEKALRAGEDLVVEDISLGESPTGSDPSWEGRPCGIWVLRRKFSTKINQAVTEVDVLFGVDAVDPR